jgi:hypothetical protein
MVQQLDLDPLIKRRQIYTLAQGEFRQVHVSTDSSPNLRNLGCRVEGASESRSLDNVSRLSYFAFDSDRIADIARRRFSAIGRSN